MSVRWIAGYQRRSVAMFATGGGIAPSASSFLPGTTTTSSGGLGVAVGAIHLAVAARFAAAANPYKVLGIPQGSNRETIKKAYRVQAKKFHPDTPGGSHEKFQEIQLAYDQIKTGVWIRKDDGSGGAQSGGGGNRYSNFQYTTRGSGDRRTYDDVYTDLHTGKRRAHQDGNDDDAGAAKDAQARKRRATASDARVQAWFRLIFGWTAVFIVSRLILLVAFPPKHQVHKKPALPAPRKPPPPKPLSPALV